MLQEKNFQNIFLSFVLDEMFIVFLFQEISTEICPEKFLGGLVLNNENAEKRNISVYLS